MLQNFRYFNTFNIQDMLERINLHRKDVKLLLETGSQLLDGSDDSRFVDDINVKFVELENLVNERHLFFEKLLTKWRLFMERKNRLKEVMKSSRMISSLNKLQSEKLLQTYTQECQVILDEKTECRKKLFFDNIFPESVNIKCL